MELISREEVERLLIKWFTQCTEEEFFDLKKAVDELPEIKIDEGYIEELERKVNESRQKGKWIDNGQVRKIGGYSADCSVCGEWSEYLTNFCGNCGADMRGEE